MGGKFSNVKLLLLQVEVYEATTRCLIDNVLTGYNATVFAYGPTGQLVASG